MVIGLIPHFGENNTGIRRKGSGARFTGEAEEALIHQPIRARSGLR
jgi:hypothetical protein